MPRRAVLVVHTLFSLRGKHIERGVIISDPSDMAFVQREHPEKVTRAIHDVDDEPALEVEFEPATEARAVGPEPAPVPVEVVE